MSVDSGLFGPSSVTWHLHADPAMWIGGISALHLQALHPLAAMGIVQNSSFEEDPLGRLVSTGSFIVQTTWGTRAEAEQAGARVRAVHARMRIHEPSTGRIHRLDSPDLLLWVHCALTRSNLHAVRRGGLKLTSRQADRYVHEQRTIAALVGLDPTDAPGTTADLDDYLTGMHGTLAASTEAMVTTASCPGRRSTDCTEHCARHGPPPPAWATRSSLPRPRPSTGDPDYLRPWRLRPYARPAPQPC
ncbi:oxygenase MpaB family protein [Kitasatospora sp. MAP12-22]|uniref:oxygenase MpaB family protein n=1 Tax=unclassified Kitasatospora TaxID=2633591 RepID=UPI0035155ADE